MTIKVRNRFTEVCDVHVRKTTIKEHLNVTDIMARKTAYDPKLIRHYRVNKFAVARDIFVEIWGSRAKHSSQTSKDFAYELQWVRKSMKEG